MKNVIPFLFLFLLGINNVFVGYRFLGFSYDRLFELLAFIFLFPSIIKDVNEDSNFKSILIFFISIFILRIFVVFLANIDGVYVDMQVGREIIRSFYFTVILCLIYFALKRNENSINIYLFTMTFISLMGFFQNPFTPLTDFASDLKMNYFVDNMSPEEYANAFDSLSIFGFIPRVTGPYGSAVPFSYALLTSLTVASYMYISEKRKIYLYLIIFFFLVGIMTLSRSLFIASSIVLLYVLYDMFRKKIVVLFSLLIPFFVFAFLVILSETRLLEFDLSKNAGSSRINAVIAGFVTIIEEPIYATSETYLKNFELSCLQFKLGDCYSVISSHNGFVNVSEENTILGLFILLLIFYYLYKYCSSLERTKKGIFTIGLIAYIIQISFHNNILFLSEYTFILIIVLILLEKRKMNTISIT